jgi:DNA-binding NarL/FixJ family response regulator
VEIGEANGEGSVLDFCGAEPATGTAAADVTAPIKVAVVDENEIFRRGLSVCLSEDPSIELVGVREADVAVVSPLAAGRRRYRCPLVMCGDGARNDQVGDNVVLGTLVRASVRPEQLVATVHAAAAGLEVRADRRCAAGNPPLDSRCLAVLAMLADGAGTYEISESLHYSERTIKALISEIQRALDARTRAHAVAAGIRLGVI